MRQQIKEHLDNGLSPGWHQAIICTNAWIQLIWSVGTHFNEILSKIHTFSFQKCINACEKVVREMVAILPRPQCSNVYGVYLYVLGY